MRAEVRMSVVAVVGAGALLPNGAFAQQLTCNADRQTVVEYLAGTYNEAPVAMGLANNGGVLEVLKSSEDSTWTILLTMPDGRTCMVAAGQFWEDVPKAIVTAEPKA